MSFEAFVALNVEPLAIVEVVEKTLPIVQLEKGKTAFLQVYEAMCNGMSSKDALIYYQQLKKSPGYEKLPSVVPGIKKVPV